MHVTLLTGFLGADKTTFLKRLLREYATDRSFGVIVNDLSELEVDRTAGEVFEDPWPKELANL